MDENLKDYSPVALRKRLAAEGLPGYRADQIAGWLYGRGVEDPHAMTDLDRELREHLATRFGPTMAP
jgi:adenine C2-methylase RlmN of 23S rRNA A2503 and tRNA A37